MGKVISIGSTSWGGVVGSGGSVFSPPPSKARKELTKTMKKLHDQACDIIHIDPNLEGLSDRDRGFFEVMRKAKGASYGQVNWMDAIHNRIVRKPAKNADQCPRNGEK